MLHLDQKVKGRYVKLGSLGWVKLKDIIKAERGTDRGKPILFIHKKGAIVPDAYMGDQVEYVKQVLDREAGK